jgi:LuxR family transcriptional regulator, maltose regulon positive regulatory protein
VTALDLRPHAPLLPPATIERARLHETLDASCERPLTLISAPAGWGKTVLLASWAGTRGAAWMTLAARHSDAARLLADVEEALRATPAKAPALVLDDVHRLRGGGLAALRELVDDRAISVVAGARFDPDLRLGRLRVAGRLSELRAADLAFTAAEGAELLAAMGVSLRADQVGRLVARTEGWAAGLRLAGLTLAGETDPEAFVAGFAGDDRAVADYLTGEVLDGQPPATRAFLLHTSVADRLCGELAVAICGAPDGALTLERLARAGMFLVALDRRQRWYRYHGLFREHLRARLRLEQPGVERELHARAAAWLAANGRGAEAVPHALAAGDAGGCDELLAEQWVELLAGGQDAAVVAAASDRRRHDARLAVAAASGLLERGDAAAAWARLEGAHAAGGDVGSAAALLHARARGDIAAARAASTGLRAPARPAPPDALRAVAHHELGATEFAHGLPDAAAEQLEAAAALASEAGAEWVLFAAAARSAALEAAAGRLVRAHKAGYDAIATAESRRWHRSAPAAWAYAALAAVDWQRDELDAAERRCDAAAVAAHASADGQALSAVRALRAHLAAARGDVERSRGLLTAVAHDMAESGPLLRRWVEALGPAAWDPPGDGAPIAEASAWLRRGDPLAALRRVERLAEGDPPSHTAARLHALVITAVARHSLARPQEAAHALEHALAIASAEGYRRPFLTGLPLRRLLERELDRPTPYAPLVAELLDAIAQRDEPPAGLLEPLSERERAVLRLLPTLLSYAEIGAELFVAANTVKTHVKSIYRKLDVGSRREAVARGRALRLI